MDNSRHAVTSKFGHYAAALGVLLMKSYPHIDSNATLSRAQASPVGNRSLSVLIAFGGGLLLWLAMYCAIDHSPKESKQLVQSIHLPTIQPAINVIGLLHHYAHRQLRDINQTKCLIRLWDRESRWNPRARNGKYYGIPQLPIRQVINLNSWQQIDKGLLYIRYRYGLPCKALAHSLKRNWY